MSKERVIMSEVTELFSNPDTIQNDLAEAFDLMREHLHNKYVHKMKRAVVTCQASVKENPSDEVKLLKAFKPFAPEQSQPQINNLIDMLHTYNAFAEMRYGLDKTKISAAPSDDIRISTQSSPTDASVHSDGVYDIDKNCYINTFGSHPSTAFPEMAGMMMLMAMMGRGTK